MKFLTVRNMIAIAFIAIGLISPLSKFFPVNPNPPIPNAILNIDKPTDDILSVVKPIADLVSDPTDRAKIAIFSQEFATRLVTYKDTDVQQLNDVLSLAAEGFFHGEIKGKYANFGDKVIELIVLSTGDENHQLSDSEKSELSAKFMGLAWALIQRK